jgi:hypothetical protein
LQFDRTVSSARALSKKKQNQMESLMQEPVFSSSTLVYGILCI